MHALCGVRRSTIPATVSVPDKAAQLLNGAAEVAAGAHQLAVLNWLAASGPQPVEAVAARLLRASQVPRHVAQPLVAKLLRVVVQADTAAVVAPFWWQAPCVIVDRQYPA